MVVKTFRGQLADGGQDHIRLQTIKGKVGYRIVKFQIMGPDADTNIESVLKIYKKSTTASTDINFTDTDLLAAAILNEENNPHYLPTPIIIFDQEIFNQDIYVTAKGTYSVDINYYIELEVIPLTDSDAEFTTLKDIRGRNTTP